MPRSAHSGRTPPYTSHNTQPKTRHTKKANTHWVSHEYPPYYHRHALPKPRAPLANYPYPSHDEQGLEARALVSANSHEELEHALDHNHLERKVGLLRIGETQELVPR